MKVDVAIIGGSVAGATLGNLLGQQGVRTVIIEAREFPRRKACGECLSDIALEFLAKAGIADEILSEEHVKIHGYKVGKTRFLESDELKGIGIRRSVLDSALVRSARAHHSVQTLYGVRVTKVFETNSKQYLLETDAGEIHAKKLVLADGVNSKSAAQLWVPVLSGENPVWGYSWLLEGKYEHLPNAVHVSPGSNHEVYLTPVSKSHLNVSFLIKKSQVKAFPRKALEEVNSELVDIGFSGEPVDEPLFIGPLGTSSRPVVQNNTFLIGDALESVDPISGMGMTLAILSAGLVGEALSDILLRAADPLATKQKLAGDREALYRPFRGFTKLSKTLIRTRSPLLHPLSKTFLPHLCRSQLGVPQGSSVVSSLLAILGAY